MFLLTWTFNGVSGKCSSSFVFDFYSASPDFPLGANNPQGWTLSDFKGPVPETII